MEIRPEPKKSLRVLHVIDSGGLYGAEMMLLNLASEQNRLGIEPTIASIGEKGIAEKPLEMEARKRGVKVVTFRMTPGPNPWGAWAILRFARRECFDLIHSHGYKGNILLGFIPRFIRKIPLVSTLHGWTSGGGLSKMRLYEWLDARSLKRIERVVVVNRQMLAHPGLKASRLSNPLVVDNGIAPFSRTWSINSDDIISEFCREGVVIGSVGRLSREKGYQFLIEAFSQFHRQVPEAKLVIIGEGYERKALGDLIHCKGLETRVLLPGYIPNAWRYLPLFRMFVISSLTEGLPITLLEAMQTGLPIVSTRVGGIPDVLQDGAAGVLVDPGDSTALFKEMLNLQQSPEMSIRLGQSAREISMSRYSAQRMALEYRDIYDSVA